VYGRLVTNWRIVIIVAVAIALACWAAIIVLHQQDKADAAAASNAPTPSLCEETGYTLNGYTYEGKKQWVNGDTERKYPSKATCVASTAGGGYSYTVRDRAPDWLRFIAVSVVVLAAASIPALSERRRLRTE
jgi:hypothetical protein